MGVSITMSVGPSDSPKLISLAVFLLPFLFLQAPMVLGAPSRCPEFCNCIDKFVHCVDFSFLDMSLMPPSVETLILSKGDVEEIPPAFLATAPNLTILELTSVQVRIIRGSAFRGLHKLHRLIITGSTFDIVEPDSFSGLSMIDKFDIIDSKFGRVGKHAFGHIKNISELNLWSNSFDHFANEAFLGLENIGTLQIIRNNITRIGKDLFADAKAIDTVTILENKIGEASAGSFDTLAYVSKRMVFRNNLFLCTCELSWMLDQPALDEFMDTNECAFTADIHVAEKNNKFRLSQTEKAVLCPKDIFDTSYPGAISLTQEELENLVEGNDKYIDESSWVQPFYEQFEDFDEDNFKFDDIFLKSEYFDGEQILNDSFLLDKDVISDTIVEFDNDGGFEANSDDSIKIGNGEQFETGVTDDNILELDDDERFDEHNPGNSDETIEGKTFEPDVVSDDIFEFEEDNQDEFFQETKSTEMYPEMDESTDIVTSGDPYRAEEEWNYMETTHAQTDLKVNNNAQTQGATTNEYYNANEREQSATKVDNLEEKHYVSEGIEHVDDRNTQELGELTTSSFTVERNSETTVNSHYLESTDSTFGVTDLRVATKPEGSSPAVEEKVETVEPMTETFDLDTGHIFDYDFSFDNPSKPAHEGNRLWEAITTRVTEKPETRPTTAAEMVFPSDELVTLATKESSQSETWTRPGPDVNIEKWEPRQHGRAEFFNSPRDEKENSSSSSVPKYLLSFVCLLACMLSKRWPVV